MYRCMSLVAQMQGGALIIGSRQSADTLRIQRFLSGNRHPNRLLDPEIDPEAEGILTAMNLTQQEFPVVISGSIILQNPNNSTLAENLGLFEAIRSETVFDVAIIGAGPAGLAAAVYAASEGLQTVVIEGESPGGQAGTSSRIENYLGFPAGISGSDLAALAQAQAQKFGAKLVVSQKVTAVDCSTRPFVLGLEQGSLVKAKSVVVATGASYRKLNVPNLRDFEMDGIHYSATSIEARLCLGNEVVVVGGGNSAGQAAMFLSAYASHVHILIRGSELAASMSDYLASRILSSKHITLHRNCEIVRLEGEKRLRAVVWRSSASGQEVFKNIQNVFVMIGADPCTQFLSRKITLDANRFILTGATESPFSTSVPGLYAVGDVRSGSIKRVASAVGEGSVVVSAIHQYLASVVSAEAARKEIYAH